MQSVWPGRPCPACCPPPAAHSWPLQAAALSACDVPLVTSASTAEAHGTTACALRVCTCVCTAVTVHQHVEAAFGCTDGPQAPASPPLQIPTGPGSYAGPPGAPSPLWAVHGASLVPEGSVRVSVASGLRLGLGGEGGDREQLLGGLGSSGDCFSRHAPSGHVGQPVLWSWGCDP